MHSQLNISVIHFHASLSLFDNHFMIIGENVVTLQLKLYE